MLDAITLDQLRTFVAVADEGSFSAAGRRLKRVQSAVSHAMANLESLLGLQLWDRSTKIPTLTEQGEVLLREARRICADVDGLKRVAEGLTGGLEASLSLAVDAFLPVRALVDVCREFAAKFPSVQLRVHTETLSTVSSLVIDGTCQIGIVGPAAQTHGLEREQIAVVRLVPVVAKNHPLARIRGRISNRVIAEHVNIVLSERDGGRTPDQGVLSTQTWRVADLSTKRALLLGGLGWGNMPEHMVEKDLASGRLVRIRPAAWSEEEWTLSLSIVHRPDLAKGPATRWLLERMVELCLRAIKKKSRPRHPG
jgi:DNA-binding transcriptional LysR family regulator